MTFSQLDLLVAVHLAAEGSYKDYPTHAERLLFALRVQDHYCNRRSDTFFRYNTDQVLHMYQTYRKQRSARIKAEIALTHGVVCFWSGRGLGPCDDHAEAGHIIPKSRNGALAAANFFIECRAHNNQRRDRSIEEFLRSGSGCLTSGEALRAMLEPTP